MLEVDLRLPSRGCLTRAMRPRPSDDVLEGFGVDVDAMPLEGGEGLSFRAGDLVLKRVHDNEEAEWTQALLSRVEADGFRFAEPIATHDGAWVRDGWAASTFIPGLRPAAPAWHEIARAGLRFGDAAERVRDGGGAVLARRTHRWAVADRVAWGEGSVALGAECAEVRDAISHLLDSRAEDEHFVHGDLSGNVFFDDAGVPVILDVSPYLRPREWAGAIVIADAVLWNGADLSLARSFAGDSQHRDLLARALIFRLVAEQLADDPRHHALLQPYRDVLRALR